MRLSTLQLTGLAAALALSGTVLAAPTTSQAAAFCQSLVRTATKGENVIHDNQAGFNCQSSASTLHVAQFPGSGGSRTEVTPGVMRTLTNAMSSDNRGEG